jgi:hypothetical protein
MFFLVFDVVKFVVLTFSHKFEYETPQKTNKTENCTSNKSQILTKKIARTKQEPRSTKLLFTSTNKLRCGQNILPNRFKSITNRIDASWLSLSKEIYKQKCKNEFITMPLTLY